MIRNLKSKLTSANLFIAALLLFGISGLAASMAISIEKTDLIRHPDTKLVCDLNPVYSCGKIIDSAPSKTLWLPNELIGIFMFAVLICVGVVMLSGAKMKKQFWWAFSLGMLGFMANIIRLFWVSLYEINALCILCTAVWFSGWVITVTGYAWLYDEKLLPIHTRLRRLARFARRNIVGVWLLFILVLMFWALNHFWYYYGQYFGVK